MVPGRGPGRLESESVSVDARQRHFNNRRSAIIAVRPYLGARIPDVSLLSAIGSGLVAGAAGTIAMTLSELLEMRLSGRQASHVPGQVGANLIPGRNQSFAN